MSFFNENLNFDRIYKIYSVSRDMEDKHEDLSDIESKYLHGAIDAMLALMGESNRFTNLIELDVVDENESELFFEELKKCFLDTETQGELNEEI